MDRCRLMAVACAAAAALDAVTPRPGLSAAGRWRRDPGPLQLSVLTGVAYEVCAEACGRGRLAAHRSIEAPATSPWLEGVKLFTSVGGNPGLGSTLLLSLQAASLGYALELYGDDELEHVMGSSEAIVELEGVQGAVNFYRGLQLAAPSYLGRVGYLGLPDAAAGPLALNELEERGVTLAELALKGSLYDPVLRDVASCLAVSLGYAYSVASAALGGDELSVLAAVEAATYAVAGWLDDLVLKRKLGRSLRSLWELAFRGSPEARLLLQLELSGAEAGPGSAADVVVNAAARLVYEILAQGGRRGGRLGRGGRG